MATTAHSRRRRGFNPYAVLGRLIGVLGVLAFIFSVASPEDDDLQQEVALRSESRPSLVQHRNSIASTRVILNGSVHHALVARTLVSFHYRAIQRVRMPALKIWDTVVAKRLLDRSPPTGSSFTYLIA